MADVPRPRWSNTWWWKRHTAVNVGFVLAILAFLAWTTFFP